MPIRNEPIIPNRALGRRKKLLGFFPSYLTPGLFAAVFVAAITTEMTKNKVTAVLTGGTVIAAYWLYAGKGEEEAWNNFGRLLPVPIFHMPDQTNHDTLHETVDVPPRR